MAEVTKQMAQKLTANLTMTKKDIILANFLGGLSWGVGTVIGASVIVVVFGWVLNILGFFDVFKQFPQIPSGPLQR